MKINAPTGRLCFSFLADHEICLRRKNICGQNHDNGVKPLYLIHNTGNIKYNFKRNLNSVNC